MTKRNSQADRAQTGMAEAPLGDLFGGRRAGLKDHRHGHRKRLRERFMMDRGQSMPDYEILELVLCSAMRNGDMKPLAKSLLAEFNDLAHVIAAPPARLKEVKGVGDAVVTQLKLIEAAAARMARSKVIKRDAIASWDQLVEYCQTAMSLRDTEQFRILFLDAKNVLIADEAQQKGTVDHVPVYPREVAKRALELNASAIILVHNHPSGDPTPSQADIDMTQQIEAALTALRISLHDHIIIGKSQITSFHDLGLL